jgi:hypothetical protein
MALLVVMVCHTVLLIALGAHVDASSEADVTFAVQRYTSAVFCSDISFLQYSAAPVVYA